MEIVTTAHLPELARCGANATATRCNSAATCFFVETDVPTFGNDADFISLAHADKFSDDRKRCWKREGIV
jgi:hypothetical protein